MSVDNRSKIWVQSRPYSMVVPSEPSTNWPLMKIPVLKETLPLKAGVSNSWVKTDGMMDVGGRRTKVHEGYIYVDRSSVRSLSSRANGVIAVIRWSSPWGLRPLDQKHADDELH